MQLFDKRGEIVSICGRVRYFFTYTEWGSLFWLAPAWGIVLAYGLRYEFTSPMKIFLGSIWYFGWLIWQRNCKNKKQSYIYVGNYSINKNIIRPGITSPAVKFFILVMLMVLAGIGAFHTCNEIDRYNEINAYYLGAEGTYTARVMTLPERVILQGEEYLKFNGELVTMIPDKAATEAKPIKASGQLMIYIKPTEAMKLTPVLPGQYVLVKGRTGQLMQTPEEGRIDLRPRYILDGRVGNLYEGTYLGLDTSVKLSWYTRIIDRCEYFVGLARWSLMNRISVNLQGQLGSVGQSLLLGGGYSSIDGAVMDSFAKTGLIHILSVSGSHVALLFGFVFVIAKIFKVKKKPATYGAIIFVILYCAVVGFNPPVVRSAVMGIIMGVGLIRGNLYHSRQALNISAALMLAHEPLLLLDISFQLSLGATYGILLFSRTLYQRLPKGRPYIMGPISLCLSAQLLIWPLQLYYFHLMGYGSLLAAIIVGPLLDLAILGTAVLLLLQIILSVNFLWSWLGLLLKLALFLNFSVASLPGAVMWLGALPVWLGILYVLGCRQLYAVMQEWKVRSLSYEMLTMGALFILLLLPMIHLTGEKVFVHIIPVTKGASFLVVKKESLHMPRGFLYVTTGGKALSNMTQSSIINSIHYYGIQRLSGVILQEVNEKSKDSVMSLLHSLQCPIANAQKSSINKDTYIGLYSRDFEREIKEYPGMILVDGAKEGFIFGNRQITQNNLKLEEMKPYIVGTTNSAMASKSYNEKSEMMGMVYWPNSGSHADVDPADSTRYITGTRVVPDFLL